MFQAKKPEVEPGNKRSRKQRSLYVGDVVYEDRSSRSRKFRSVYTAKVSQNYDYSTDLVIFAIQDNSKLLMPQQNFLRW